MINYDNYSIEKEHNRVAFSARAITIVERDELVETGHVPAHWHDILRRKIDFDKYDQYCICIHERMHGFYNRLTDYKGIWEISGLPHGMADYSYDVNHGRVYWGVIKTSIEPPWYHISNAIILLPSGETFPTDILKQLWSNDQIGFETSPNKDFFQKVLNILPNAYLIHYTEDEICRLELYGFQVENKFCLSDISTQ